jgi:hypothetical protein
MPIDDPLTHSIIGCAMEVNNVLGNGFQACPEPVEGRLYTNGFKQLSLLNYCGFV